MMGSEISKKVFTKEDLQSFKNAFLDELEFVKELFGKGSSVFSNKYCIGYELEVCILDNNNLPSPINNKIIDDIGSPLFTNELAKYDLEINGNVFDIDAKTPQKLKYDILSLWQNAQESAQKFDAHLGLLECFHHLNLNTLTKNSTNQICTDTP
jgi:hypothetical protein